MCLGAQELDYIELNLCSDKGAAAAEASAACEAQAAQLAKDARAEAAVVRWQYVGQLVTSQRAAVPAQDSSPAACATTPAAEAASCQPSSLPDEAAAPPAVEDLCIATITRCSI